MGIGVSLILIAVGAILTWAVETSVSGLDVNAVGVILMIVGAGRARAFAGLLVDLVGSRVFPADSGFRPGQVGGGTSSSRTPLPTRSSSGTSGELRRGAPPVAGLHWCRAALRPPEPAPEPLRLVQRLVNTVDFERDRDWLADLLSEEGAQATPHGARPCP